MEPRHALNTISYTPLSLDALGITLPSSLPPTAPDSMSMPTGPRRPPRASMHPSPHPLSQGEIFLRSSTGMQGLEQAEFGNAMLQLDPSGRGSGFRQGDLIHPDNLTPFQPRQRRHSLAAPTASQLYSAKPLARHGTILSNRPSASELDAVLSNSSRRLINLEDNPEATNTSLEHSRSGARIELDITLESNFAVEGSDFRGTLEVRVRKIRKGSEPLLIGGAKLRVVGFEAIQNERHTFYQHSQSLESASKSLSSLYAPEQNEQGYHEALVGTHLIPFALSLPSAGGAKGSLTGKPATIASVRYIILASIKIQSTEARKPSIAHFFRSIHVYPSFNSEIFKSLSHPVQQSSSKSLFLGGRGKLNVTAAMPRLNWTAGQQCWVTVIIHNDTTKRVKSLSLILMRSVTAFRPVPALNAVSPDPPGTRTASEIDMDACQTATVRKQVAETVLECGQKGSRGLVTTKGWWLGVKGGDQCKLRLDILIPSDALSIPRSRLVEVSYTLRLTAVAGGLASEVGVDLPINIISSLSIDPPADVDIDPGLVPFPTSHNLSSPYQIPTSYTPTPSPATSGSIPCSAIVHRNRSVSMPSRKKAVSFSQDTTHKHNTHNENVYAADSQPRSSESSKFMNHPPTTIQSGPHAANRPNDITSIDTRFSHRIPVSGLPPAIHPHDDNRKFRVSQPQRPASSTPSSSIPRAAPTVRRSQSAAVLNERARRQSGRNSSYPDAGMDGDSDGGNIDQVSRNLLLKASSSFHTLPNENEARRGALSVEESDDDEVSFVIGSARLDDGEDTAHFPDPSLNRPPFPNQTGMGPDQDDQYRRSPDYKVPPGSTPRGMSASTTMINIHSPLTRDRSPLPSPSVRDHLRTKIRPQSATNTPPAATDHSQASRARFSAEDSDILSPPSSLPYRAGAGATSALVQQEPEGLPRIARTVLSPSSGSSTPRTNPQSLRSISRARSMADLRQRVQITLEQMGSRPLTTYIPTRIVPTYSDSDKDDDVHESSSPTPVLSSNDHGPADSSSQSSSSPRDYRQPLPPVISEMPSGKDNSHESLDNTPRPRYTGSQAEILDGYTSSSKNRHQARSSTASSIYSTSTNHTTHTTSQRSISSVKARVALLEQRSRSMNQEALAVAGDRNSLGIGMTPSLSSSVSSKITMRRGLPPSQSQRNGDELRGPGMGGDYIRPGRPRGKTLDSAGGSFSPFRYQQDLLKERKLSASGLYDGLERSG